MPACLLRPSLYGTLSAQHILAGTCLYHVPPGRRLPCGGGGRAHHRGPLLNIKGTQSRNSPDTAEAASGLFVSRCLLQDGPPVGGGNHFGVPGQIAGLDLGLGADPLGPPGLQLLVGHLQGDGVGRATSLSRPMPAMAEVGLSISRMPGPPLGPS